ncbi:hypothetical protein CANARDRAFT_97039 [[Candida] arabinofermentans NRRL YB-2248]|uniref:Uncharacterized protein n=1 Tax=[Candida] arabinofermentans NRRL YB-2248 TaxID=983967 RepID=A0A1E4T6W6_9ASCO|nr:hypothetical protein CANARDRAFT_97039 [[Candida] arabinofermentans NRRL YB-2248]
MEYDSYCTMNSWLAGSIIKKDTPLPLRLIFSFSFELSTATCNKRASIVASVRQVGILEYRVSVVKKQ